VFMRNTSALPSIGARTLNMDGCIGRCCGNCQRAEWVAPTQQTATDVPDVHSLSKESQTCGAVRARATVHAGLIGLFVTAPTGVGECTEAGSALESANALAAPAKILASENW
jgi:hypothetical protein